MDEDWVVLCQSLYQSSGRRVDRHARNVQKKVCRKMRVKKVGQRIVGLGKVAWRKTEKEPFFSSKSCMQQKVGTVGVSDVDIHKALRFFCEERHATVEGSEVSYGSFDRVDDPWDSQV